MNTSILTPRFDSEAKCACRSRHLLACLLSLVILACTGSGEIVGALPDGTTYAITNARGGSEPVTGVQAVISVELPDGTSPAIGITTFMSARSSKSEPHWSGDTLSIPAGEWTIRIEMYEHVLESLGPDAKTRIQQAITVTSMEGLPVLSLKEPLRFADDREVHSFLEVTYESFAVRRGCGSPPESVCSDDESIQIVPFGPAESNNGRTDASGLSIDRT